MNTYLPHIFSSGMESEEASNSSSEDSFIFNSEEEFNGLVERETEEEGIRDVFKINRSVNRTDYSRSKKRLKSTDPWSTNFWLQTLADPTIKDPFSRNGKKFRRDFRIPYIIFEEILTMLKHTGERPFNYSEVTIGGKPSIPLELKVLCALRTLGSGLKCCNQVIQIHKPLTPLHKSVKLAEQLSHGTNVASIDLTHPGNPSMENCNIDVCRSSPLRRFK